MIIVDVMLKDRDIIVQSAMRKFLKSVECEYQAIEGGTRIFIIDERELEHIMRGIEVNSGVRPQIDRIQMTI